MKRFAFLLLFPACVIDAPHYVQPDPDASTAIDAIPPDANPGPYEIGGSVNGMWDGATISLHLQATGVDAIKTFSANGAFAFDELLPTDTSYAVSVATGPSSHTCDVVGGAGTTVDADISDIQINCDGPAVTIAFSAPIAWTFDAGTTTYDLDTSIVIQQSSLTVTSAAATAITLNGSTPLTSGAASAVLPFAFGANSETVKVDVGALSRTFTIGIDRGGAQVQQYVYGKASNTDAGDWFGVAVAVSGDVMVVGASQEDSNSASTQSNDSLADAGAAYVFRRNGSTWVQEAYLKASSIDMGDNFGISVAVSGDTIAVGASAEDSSAIGINGSSTDDGAQDAGAVYVYRKNGGTWSLEAYVKASNTEADDGFGLTVALDGDTLAVGAIGEDSQIPTDQSNNGHPYSGAVYVFHRNGTSWSQEAYLKASNHDAGDRFGNALALSGNSLAVAAYSERGCATGVNGNESDNLCTSAGAVYVFVRSGSAWSQQAYVKASNTAAMDLFGFSVDIDNDRLLVGAKGEDSGNAGSQGDNSAPGAGAAYLFQRTGTLWTQTAYVKEPAPAGNRAFGDKVSLAGDLLAIAAPPESPGGVISVFRINAATVSFEQGISSSNAEGSDQVGSALDLSEDLLVAGASLEDSLGVGVDPSDTGNGPAGSTTDSGAAYVFR